MDYTFVVKLPKHLEKAYEAGKIIITSGVARDATTKQIVGHLEHIVGNATSRGLSGDYIQMFYGMAVDSAKLGIEIHNAQKLNQIINLVQNLQVLSCVNIAMTGVNLGVSIVGFALVISQLNQIDHKLNLILQGINHLINNENRKLLSKTKNYIKKVITLLNQLESSKSILILDLQVEDTLNEIETHIEDLISRYTNRASMNVPLHYIQALYVAYCNLLKSYLTSKYLSQGDLQCISYKIQILENITIKMVSEDIMDLLYEECLLNEEKRLSETELNVILRLFKSSSHESLEKVKTHQEILSTTPIEKFKTWQYLIKDSNESLIWMPH
jgi:hypothetical protein